MKLIIGGAAQGKRGFACKTFGLSTEDFISGETASFVQLETAVAVQDFHLFVKHQLASGQLQDKIEALLDQNPHLVILCDEIGCGIVPIDKQDRAYREAVGRICCFLAERAERVDRVFCGIGMTLKETEN